MAGTGNSRSKDAAEDEISEVVRQRIQGVAVAAVALLAGVAVITVLMTSYLAARLDALPPLDGREVALSRDDLDLLWFKGYTVGTPIKVRRPVGACAWLYVEKAGATSYICTADHRPGGACGDEFACRSHVLASPAGVAARKLASTGRLAQRATF